MSKKLMLASLLFMIIVFMMVYVGNSSITWRLSIEKKLTPRILYVNGIPTDSFSFKRFYGEKPYRDANLTIVVEILYNHYKPVNKATVTIYGYGGIDTNNTNKKGIAILHIHIRPLWNRNTPEGYLSMIATKGKYVEIMDRAVRIMFE